MKNHVVRDVMSSAPLVIAAPDEPLKRIAQRMASANCGIIPIGTPHNLIGMVSDRDIVLRGIGSGKDVSKLRARDVMKSGIYAILEDAPLTEAALLMKKYKVNRLIVVNELNHPVGILSLSGLMRETSGTRDIVSFLEQMALNKKVYVRQAA